MRILVDSPDILKKFVKKRLGHFGEGKRLQRRDAALATTAGKTRHMFVSYLTLFMEVFASFC